VALVVEAGGGRDLGKRLASANEPARQLDSPLQDVGVRGEAQLAREPAEQLVAAEADLRGELDEGGRGRGIGRGAGTLRP